MRSAIATVVIAVLTVSCFAQADAPRAEATDTNFIATVLGKKIVASEKDKLNGLIFGALLQQFATENKIEPTEEELDLLVLKTEEQLKQLQITMLADRKKLIEELKNSSLSDREREQKASHLKTIESILKTTGEMKEKTKGMEEQMRPMKRQMA